MISRSMLRLWIRLRGARRRKWDRNAAALAQATVRSSVCYACSELACGRIRSKRRCFRDLKGSVAGGRTLHLDPLQIATIAAPHRPGETSHGASHNTTIVATHERRTGLPLKRRIAGDAYRCCDHLGHFCSSDGRLHYTAAMRTVGGTIGPRAQPPGVIGVQAV